MTMSEALDSIKTLLKMRTGRVIVTVATCLGFVFPKLALSQHIPQNFDTVDVFVTQVMFALAFLATGMIAEGAIHGSKEKSLANARAQDEKEKIAEIARYKCDACAFSGVFECVEGYNKHQVRMFEYMCPQCKTKYTTSLELFGRNPVKNINGVPKMMSKVPMYL